MSRTTTVARMHRDGTVVEVLDDGTERPFPDTPMRPMTEAEVHAAALNDPDAQSLTDEALARMKPVPRAKTLRRALGLTQEEFAGRYHIPIGTLRDRATMRWPSYIAANRVDGAVLQARR
jgi:putative transcriptional regulator